MDDLNELHNLANTTFQNVTNLSPMLRQMVANAKIYQKSVQTTCNLAVMFIESMQNVANAATVSQGATKKLGEVIEDIIDAYKEIENMKLELTKLFINEVIIPLESRAEIEINNMKGTHKSYNSENKIQTELAEKARATVSKIKKKSIRKKKSPKLEEKEKLGVQTLDEEEKKLKQVREEGLRKALIEERRVYCFVAERMCTYGRGMIIYNNRISNFINQKLPDWQQYIAKPTELPEDSEAIIANPTGYKMGTVRRKMSRSDKKEAVKRGKSFNNHFPTKYSTFDGRSSRGGSRPSLSAVTVSSVSNLSDGSHSNTPTRRAPGTPGISSLHSPSFSMPPRSITDDNLSLSAAHGGSPTSETIQIKMYEPPKLHTAAASPTRSEYANLVVLNKHDENSLAARSHSFTAPRKESNDQKVTLNRTESAVCDGMKRSIPNALSEGADSSSDFASRLAMIQNQLSQKLNEPPADDPTSKSCLRALYDHLAQDQSQLNFVKDDIILPICEATAGWQYGEHEKTKKSGWFPSAFTEEVIITSTGETKAKPTARNTGTTHKKPPPVAKKSHRGASRKISLVTPKSQNDEVHIRSNSHGDIPMMSTSNSMPQMLHMANETSTNGHERKHSNSFQGIDFNHDDMDSFDDSAEDVAEEKTTKKKRSKPSAKDYDAMPPPPPPPPPESDEEVEGQEGDKTIVDNNDNPFNGITFQAPAAVS